MDVPSDWCIVHTPTEAKTAQIVEAKIYNLLNFSSANYASIDYGALQTSRRQRLNVTQSRIWKDGVKSMSNYAHVAWQKQT